MATFTGEADLADITEGDGAAFDLTFEDETGAAVDITGWTVWLTIKDDPGDSDADAIVQQNNTTHADPPNGLTSFSLSNADTAGVTGHKHYDIQIKRPSDSDPHTVIMGRVYFGHEITEAT
jgi:hypothetical protein